MTFALRKRIDKCCLCSIIVCKMLLEESRFQLRRYEQCVCVCVCVCVEGGGGGGGGGGF